MSVQRLLNSMDQLQCVRVECHAGYRADERPLRFFLDGRPVQVIDVLDRWIGLDHRYFKVLGSDGTVSILRHDTTDDRWELTKFDRPRQRSPTL